MLTSFKILQKATYTSETKVWQYFKWAIDGPSNSVFES